MNEPLVRKKKVKLVPTVGSMPEQTVEVPENMSVGEAIGEVFGKKLKGKKVVLQNEKDEPITEDTQAGEVEEVKITPFTEGGQLQADARQRRIIVEASKLASAHPDVTFHGNRFSCVVTPSKGPQRRIRAVITQDYPFVAPKVMLSPYDDLENVPHILAGGEICYMHLSEWNPSLHTITYVITQVKRIVYEAVTARYGR